MFSLSDNQWAHKHLKYKKSLLLLAHASITYNPSQHLSNVNQEWEKVFLSLWQKEKSKIRRRRKSLQPTWVKICSDSLLSSIKFSDLSLSLLPLPSFLSFLFLMKVILCLPQQSKISKISERCLCLFLFSSLNIYRTLYFFPLTESTILKIQEEPLSSWICSVYLLSLHSCAMCALKQCSTLKKNRLTWSP